MVLSFEAASHKPIPALELRALFHSSSLTQRLVAQRGMAAPPQGLALPAWPQARPPRPSQLALARPQLLPLPDGMG